MGYLMNLSFFVCLSWVVVLFCFVFEYRRYRVGEREFLRYWVVVNPVLMYHFIERYVLNPRLVLFILWSVSLSVIVGNRGLAKFSWLTIGAYLFNSLILLGAIYAVW